MREAATIPRRQRTADTIAGLGVFCAVFFGHAFSPVTQSCDSRYFLHVASSIARHGTLQLDEYRAALRVSGLEYGLRLRDGHVYSAYPVALPILVAPVVRLLALASGGRIDAMLRRSASTKLEIAIAESIVAAACAVLYRVLPQPVLLETGGEPDPAA